MHKAIITSVTALCVLGMLGGCLIAAGSGFTTSSKRGEWNIFVPAPEAYILAAIMFTLSGVALLWLLQQLKTRAWGYVFSAAVYVGVVVVLTQALN